MRLPSAIAPEITSATAPEIRGRARCPLCHTVDSTMTNIALSAGAEWHCSRCGQRWDTMRLAAVAGYAVWLSARTDASGNHAATAGGDVPSS